MFIKLPFGRQKIILNSDHIVSILWDEKFGGARITFSNGKFEDFAISISKAEFAVLLKKLNR